MPLLIVITVLILCFSHQVENLSIWSTVSICSAAMRSWTARIVQYV